MSGQPIPARHEPGPTASRRTSPYRKASFPSNESQSSVHSKSKSTSTSTSEEQIVKISPSTLLSGSPTHLDMISYYEGSPVNTALIDTPQGCQPLICTACSSNGPSHFSGLSTNSNRHRFAREFMPSSYPHVRFTAAFGEEPSGSELTYLQCPNDVPAANCKRCKGYHPRVHAWEILVGIDGIHTVMPTNHVQGGFGFNPTHGGPRVDFVRAHPTPRHGYVGQPGRRPNHGRGGVNDAGRVHYHGGHGTRFGSAAERSHYRASLDSRAGKPVFPTTSGYSCQYSNGLSSYTAQAGRPPQIRGRIALGSNQHAFPASSNNQEENRYPSGWFPSRPAMGASGWVGLDHLNRTSASLFPPTFTGRPRCSFDPNQSNSQGCASITGARASIGVYFARNSRHNISFELAPEHVSSEAAQLQAAVRSLYAIGNGTQLAKLEIRKAEVREELEADERARNYVPEPIGTKRKASEDSGGTGSAVGVYGNGGSGSNSDTSAPGRAPGIASIPPHTAMAHVTSIVIKLTHRSVFYGITRRVEEWKANGWKGVDGNPLVNVELWRELDWGVERLALHGIRTRFWLVEYGENGAAHAIARQALNGGTGAGVGGIDDRMRHLSLS